MNVSVPFEPPAFQAYPLFYRSEVIHGAVFHTPPQLVLEGDPRKVRELHVIVLQDGECLLTEHDLLRQYHVRDERRFALSH